MDRARRGMRSGYSAGTHGSNARLESLYAPRTVENKRHGDALSKFAPIDVTCERHLLANVQQRVRSDIHGRTNGELCAGAHGEATARESGIQSGVHSKPDRTTSRAWNGIPVFVSSSRPPTCFWKS